MTNKARLTYGPRALQVWVLSKRLMRLQNADFMAIS